MKMYIKDKDPAISLFDLVLTNDPGMMDHMLLGWVVEKKPDSIYGEDVYTVEWTDGVRTDHNSNTIELLRDNVGKQLRGATHLINIKT